MKAESDILKKADIVLVTCSTSADNRRMPKTFRSVLVDEAGNSVDADIMMPVVKAKERVVLIGDPKQLPPVITCKNTQVERAGAYTLFERHLRNNHVIMLKMQYRMHPDICQFPSKTFYDNELKSHACTEDNNGALKVKEMNGHRVLFIDCNGQSVNRATAKDPLEILALKNDVKSCCNLEEARLVGQYLRAILRAGFSGDDIFIITPYRAQVELIKMLTKDTCEDHHTEVHIGTVHTAQGSECRFVITSLVRSDGSDLGFTSDDHMTNVTISRAKDALIVIGNAVVMAQDRTWNKFVINSIRNGCFIECS
eukprot:TRINITY_DN508_c0_g1_i2.p1 TRINITY_DN508_c0_g1~~TRINITY_DN508_c0_g1_i2.p1  ORF type:complete len:311 (-),score=49.13 TRINITY_DN508_c0_g1_i2:14-946(-)